MIDAERDFRENEYRVIGFDLVKSRVSDTARAFADTIPHIVWALNRRGDCIWANTRFSEVTGIHSNPGFDPSNLHDVLAREDFERYTAMLRESRSCDASIEGMLRLKHVHAGYEAYRKYALTLCPLRTTNGAPELWIATATDVHEVHTAFSNRERDLEELAEVIPQIVWQMDERGLSDYFNQAWHTYTGLDRAASFGSGWKNAVHPADHAPMNRAWQTAITRDVPYDVEFRIRNNAGVYRWFLTRARALRDDQGAIKRWFGTSTDIDDHKRAEDIRQFATKVNSRIHAGCTLSTISATIADYAIENVADMCTLDLVQADGSLSRVAATHIHANGAAKLSEGTQFLGLRAQKNEHPAMRALHTRQGQYIRDWTAADTALVALSPAHRSYLESLHIGSVAYIPLVGIEGAIGVMTLMRLAGNGRYEESDATAFTEAGRRIGIAVETAQQSQRIRMVADRFQHAALPKTLPALPGISFSAVYRAAKSEALVGGDWYDAFRLDDGRIVLSIGDVMGTGLDAAVTMGAVRQTIRGATQIYPDPVAVLNAADRTLRTEQPDRIVTAFVGLLDPLTLQFTYASAGHPPPMLRRPDGSIVEISGSNLPLGLRDTGQSSESCRTITLEEQSLLVLYTDGLTELTRDIVEGERRLKEALGSDEVVQAANPAAAIANMTLALVEDDVAILAVRVEEVRLGVVRMNPLTVVPTRWKVDPRNFAAVGEMRFALCAALRERTTSEDHVVMTELLLSELLGNVIRHTNGNAEVALDLTMTSPVLHVLDRGPGFMFHACLPNSVMSESGRGLFIAAMLAKDITVMPRPDGGSHARIVLPFELARNETRPRVTRLELDAPASRIRHGNPEICL